MRLYFIWNQSTTPVRAQNTSSNGTPAAFDSAHVVTHRGGAEQGETVVLIVMGEKITMRGVMMAATSTTGTSADAIAVGSRT